MAPKPTKGRIFWIPKGMDEKISKIKNLLTLPNKESFDISGDLDYFSQTLQDQLQFFDKLTENRKLAILSLCFLYGIKGLIGKTNIILSLESQDFERAAEEILRDNRRFLDIANVIRSDML